MSEHTSTVVRGRKKRGEGDQPESRAGMQPFTTVSGPAVPLMRANIDTDIIIRIDRMTTLGRHELGPVAMEALRYRADGSLDADSVLNRPQFRGARILLAGANFGCGSSREPAVWALMEMGYRCVIAPSFGDIFFSNCFQNGMLPIRLTEAQVQALAEQCAGGTPMQVDLAKRTLTAPDGTLIPFSIDPMRREALLNGLDDIGLTLKDGALIRAWQQRDRVDRAWAWPKRRSAPPTSG